MACSCLLLMLLVGTADAVKLQGGSALALAGKGCVVLAMDQRVGTR
jgi:20S proteasome alpha/beta subunit